MYLSALSVTPLKQQQKQDLQGRRTGEEATTIKFVETGKQMDELFDLAEHNSMLRGTPDQTDLCWGYTREAQNTSESGDSRQG